MSAVTKLVEAWIEYKDAYIQGILDSSDYIHLRDCKDRDCEDISHWR